MTDDNIRYDFKCNKCNTFSVDREFSYERCMDGEERGFWNYWCVNCASDTSIRTDDEWNNVEYGETVFF